MRHCGPIILYTAAACLFVAGLAPVVRAMEPAGEGGPVDFVRDVQPIFTEHCYKCHGPRKQEGGLRWDRRALAFAPTDSGHLALVPGDPDKSRLMRVITEPDAKQRMPREADPLTAEQVALLKRWVEQGAVWPEGVDPKDEAPSHWSFVPPQRPPLPGVSNPAWARNGIDRFILARLDKEGFKPSPEADPYTLVRRVYLDLTGLPPTPPEVEAFVRDRSPDAYERLVDRLLNDPAYGERWAKMWLDLARYADSAGYGSDPLRPGVWPYRDYLIHALNRNYGFDRFTVEQMAGDLLPSSTQEHLIATTFHRNTMTNTEGGTDDEEFRVAAVKDRVNTTAQVWMGLTMGCAQCHTHKFDPITQREYYQLYAVFNQAEDHDQPDERPTLLVLSPEQEAAAAKLRDEIEQMRRTYEQPPPQVSAAQAEWEAQLPSLEQQWHVLTPRQPTASSGATFLTLEDGSLLTAGAAAPTETYTLAVDTELRGITAFRLEALPHANLPAQGPGRAGNGNFVLNDFAVAASPRGAKPIQGRFLRIENRGSPILSLAEVQAFRGDQNVAPQGKASQVSTAFGGDAARAIDGNTDGNFASNSVTHTADTQAPWWELDLGQSGEVHRVVVWNRTDSGLQTRLKDFTVSLLDESRKVVWQNVVAAAPMPMASLQVNGPLRVVLRNASADYAQPGFSAAAAIDGNIEASNGWAIVPELGKPHVVVFETQTPVGAEGDTTLTFTLTQTFPNHPLGRFRLSATTLDKPTPALPAAVAGILAIPREQRNPQQADELANYYRSISPWGRETQAKIALLEQRLAAIDQRGARVPVLRELPQGQRRVSRMMTKGNFLDQSDPVEPGVPAAFGTIPPGQPADRLGVAKWLIDPSNPLTARVAANRFWARLFGIGIVETEEDFGTQGSPPSHPELLDYLATEFVRQGWDVKAMLRLMVTSAAYRQTSRVTPELFEKDSRNRLLARGPRFRLSAEAVRDQAMALSGLLSRKVGGPSVYPPQPEGLWRVAFSGQRDWTTSMDQDRYRRGVYTFWRRTIAYPSMMAFDATSREICTVRRLRTNTPLQAFVTLNDPVYVEAAQALARRIVQEGGGTVEERVRYALTLCTSRPPHEQQVSEIMALYHSELEHYKADPSSAEPLVKPGPPGVTPLSEGADPAELAAWTVVANLLLNLDAVLMKG